MVGSLPSPTLGQGDTFSSPVAAVKPRINTDRNVIRENVLIRYRTDKTCGGRFVKEVGGWKVYQYH